MFFGNGSIENPYIFDSGDNDIDLMYKLYLQSNMELEMPQLIEQSSSKLLQMPDNQNLIPNQAPAIIPTPTPIPTPATIPTRTISGNIYLPDGHKAPKDGLIAYVGYTTDGLDYFIGDFFQIAYGSSSVSYKLSIDPEVGDASRFKVICHIPNYLDGGKPYRKTIYSDVSMFYTTKGSTQDYSLADWVVLNKGAANNINLTLSINQQ